MKLISLFCGCGGLDLGFERAGFDIELALDKEPSAIASYNRNFGGNSGVVSDLSCLTGREILDIPSGLSGEESIGVIGGPPCQYFSVGNSYKRTDDERRFMPRTFSNLVVELDDEIRVDFFLFENVKSLTSAKHRGDFDEILNILGRRFWLDHRVLDAVDYGVAQHRKRLFIVGFNRQKFDENPFEFPIPTTSFPITVKERIDGFPSPTFFSRNLTRSEIQFHPNHWTMRPVSKKFANGSLLSGKGRSFRVLEWDRPSLTVAYGNREIHVHPNLDRRLSVFEALRLQGFPWEFELLGTLSSQVTQVSNAVPPPLAEALAWAVRNVVQEYLPGRDGHI